jgi:hypothetical protein
MSGPVRPLGSGLSWCGLEIFAQQHHPDVSMIVIANEFVISPRILLTEMRPKTEAEIGHESVNVAEAGALVGIGIAFVRRKRPVLEHLAGIATDQRKTAQMLKVETRRKTGFQI